MLPYVVTLTTSQSTHPSVNPCLVSPMIVAGVRYNNVPCSCISSDRHEGAGLREQYYFSSRCARITSPARRRLLWFLFRHYSLPSTNKPKPRSLCTRHRSHEASIRSLFHAAMRFVRGILATSECNRSKNGLLIIMDDSRFE